MKQNLSKALLSMATKYNPSMTTVSDYYQIGCIKVRLSDHVSTHTNYDLDIFCNGRSTYCVMPNIGTHRNVMFFTSVKEVVEFIKQFEHFAKMLVKPYEEICREVDNTSYEFWQEKFKVFYGSRGGVLKEQLDKLYKKFLTDNTIMAKVVKCNGLKTDQKVEAYQKLLEE